MQNDKVGIDTSSGMGIFRGPEVEAAPHAREVFVIILMVVIIGTLWIVNVIGHYIPVVYCVLITVVGFLFVVEELRKEPAARLKPIPPSKTISLNGVWISGDKVLLGRQEAELNEPCFVRDLYERDCTVLRSVGPVQAAPYQCLETASVRVTIQIVNSNYNKNDYRIARVHVCKDGDILTSTVVPGEQMLVIGGRIYPCKRMTIANQLRKIAEELSPLRRCEASICSLLITPRSSSPGGAGFAFTHGVSGLLFKGAWDSVALSRAEVALRNGEFINKETSDSILTLTTDYGWEVGLTTLRMNELGLANSNW